jgi:hypothetical protein
LLTLDLGLLPEVSVPPEKVEGVIDQPVLPARGELGLEFGEIGSAFVDDHHLPVDDGLTGNVEGAGNRRKPLLRSSRNR